MITKEMLRANLKDGGWTVFLDRDGVINKRKYASYVMNRNEFQFLPGVLDALVKFAEYADNIIVVTNQRGIARRLMTEADLADIHAYFVEEVEKAGGRIDGIYYCPHDRDSGCRCRKPQPGMAEDARDEHHTIEFMRSIMFGDTFTDMQFGRLLGMHTIQIGPDKIPESYTDLRLERLIDFWR